MAKQIAGKWSYQVSHLTFIYHPGKDNIPADTLTKVYFVLISASS